MSGPVQNKSEPTTRTTGAFKDYLLGLDNVRRGVTDLETEMVNKLIKFYHATDNNEHQFNRYLCEVDSHLLECNEVLKENGETVEVNSQLQIASLVNRVKAVNSSKISPEKVKFLTDFWENIKFTVEALQMVVDKFEKNVQGRLFFNCISVGGSRSPRRKQPAEEDESRLITEDYRAEVLDYRKSLEEGLTNFRLLAASSGSRINKELLVKSALIDRLMASCHPAMFPLLELIPQLTTQLEQVFSTAKRWMDRDETYLFDIGNEIRKRKDSTRAKEAEMQKEKERQRELMKSVRSAFLMCQNSKKKLKEIASELHSLEAQVLESNHIKTQKIREKRQKESISEFLMLSISQTRRNYNIQLKRQKLNRQLKELEGNLLDIQTHITGLKQEIAEISSQHQVAEERFQDNERSYGHMRSELEVFLKNVTQIHRELDTLRGSIVHLETIQTVKISPERIDNFFEPQVTPNVKLAPSLKEKILQRKQLKMMGKSTV